MNPIKILTGIAAIVSIVTDLDKLKKQVLLLKQPSFGWLFLITIITYQKITGPIMFLTKK